MKTTPKISNRSYKRLVRQKELARSVREVASQNDWDNEIDIGKLQIADEQPELPATIEHKQEMMNDEPIGVDFIGLVWAFLGLVWLLSTRIATRMNDFLTQSDPLNYVMVAIGYAILLPLLYILFKNVSFGLRLVRRYAAQHNDPGYMMFSKTLRWLAWLAIAYAIFETVSALIQTV